MNIPILYEDDCLLIVDKPTGLLVVPTPKRESRTLTSIVNEDAKEKGGGVSLYPCHRLDRETSGIVVFAKGKSVEQKMMELFRARSVTKKYLAFVQQRMENDNGTISLPIEGKQAVTRYRVLERRSDFSVVEVFPLTGRTNQIRIHFKHIRHPLVGESKFAFRKDYRLRAKRLCLHASQLEFRHPLTGKTIVIRSPLPADLEKFLRSHEGHDESLA